MFDDSDAADVGEVKRVNLAIAFFDCQSCASIQSLIKIILLDVRSLLILDFLDCRQTLRMITRDGAGASSGAFWYW